MGQWDRWVKRVNEKVGAQHRSLGQVQEALQALGAISEPMPQEVSWELGIQCAAEGRLGEAMTGSLLEFLLSMGDMGAYQGVDAERGKVAAAIVELGDALVALGAKPSARMGPLALRMGLYNLDAPERLKAAIRWGAPSCWDPQEALATCCAHSRWHEASGQACQEMLVEQGVLSAPGLDWSSCAMERQPILAAVLASDEPTVKRLIQWGLPLDWRDPKTGLTLWHAAAALSIPMGKALLPELSKKAPQLAGSPALENVEVKKSSAAALKVRKGQTAAHCAADGVKPQALGAALSCGADPNAVDARGDTPLTLLSRRWGAKAQERAQEMAKALLAAGADPSMKDGKGNTPAQNMAAKGPLGALEPLLQARPQDVGGSAMRAKKAFKALSERGALGASQAGEAALRVEVGGVEIPRSKPRSKSAL
jgi:hypothetical protein